MTAHTVGCHVASANDSQHNTSILSLCRGVTRMAKTSGCALSGFVLVKKVPGALHFLAKSPGHSFDHGAMNMSHVVNYLYFGNKPSPRRHQVSESSIEGYDEGFLESCATSADTITVRMSHVIKSLLLSGARTSLIVLHPLILSTCNSLYLAKKLALPCQPVNCCEHVEGPL